MKEVDTNYTDFHGCKISAKTIRDKFVKSVSKFIVICIQEYSSVRAFPVSLFLPIQNHLARLPGGHDLKSLFKFGAMESVRNDRLDVQTALQHHRHLVPRLVHLAPVNALDRQHVEHNLVPVDRHRFG